MEKRTKAYNVYQVQEASINLQVATRILHHVGKLSSYGQG